jgi:hypothetical protein
MHRIFRILGGLFGVIAVCWAINGGQALYSLLEEEGTESFSAAHGFGGALGCIAFLVLFGLGALGLICYSVWNSCRAAQRT